MENRLTITLEDHRTGERYQVEIKYWEDYSKLSLQARWDLACGRLRAHVAEIMGTKLAP